MKHVLLFIMAAFLIAGSAMAQSSYVGSETCQTCHSDKYNDWVASGHPYKFSVVENGVAPTYPVEVVNFEDTWMDSLGDGTHTWADIAGVIGGYGWKARFVGTDGYIIGTAGSSFGDAGQGHNQFNFYGGEAHGWVNYETSNDHKKYNYGCFKCHTTGGDTTGTWLNGVEGLGTFSEGGVGCEACHGPGDAHAAAPSKANIDRVYEFAHLDNSIGGNVIADGDTVRPNTETDNVNYLCGTCHNRGYKAQIDAKGGFIKHHEQWDEFMTTKHYDAGFTCVTCHDPHKRVIWDGDGITKTCETCHSDKAATINHPGTKNCIECHMPYAAKSGTTRGASGFKGDVRSHLFTITPDTASMFTADGAWVRDDAERPASLSPAYSCLGCHNDASDDNIPDKTLEQAVADAINMHVATAITNDNSNTPSEFALKQNYPNPFNPSTMIEFDMPAKANVNISVYNISGQLVRTLVDGEMEAGVHQVQFNAGTLTSGMYFYRITSDNFTEMKRMTYIK